MHNHKKRAMVLAGGILASGMLLGTAALAGSSAPMLSNTCAGCHGPDGVSAGPGMPTIAGQPAGFQAEVLKQFKSGDRPSTIMQRIAAGYSDEELGQIAAHFAGKKWMNATGNPNSKMATPVDAALAEQGAKVHKSAKCYKCHDNDGRSTEDDTPRLAGQWLDYLQIKFDDYKNADLNVPQPKKMAKAIEKLSADDLKALAHFYASQQ